MRSLFLALLLLFTPQSLPLPRNYASIVVFRRIGEATACACPVGVGAFAYTARHVTNAGVDVWVDPLSPSEAGGITPVVDKEEKMDLAKVVPVPDGEARKLFPHPHPIARHPPMVGEEVIVYGMQYGVPTVFHGYAGNVDTKTGEYYIDGTSYPGSSGGCVSSLKGEVYGIITGVEGMSNRIERSSATYVPIWGRK